MISRDHVLSSSRNRLSPALPRQYYKEKNMKKLRRQLPTPQYPLSFPPILRPHRYLGCSMQAETLLQSRLVEVSSYLHTDTITAHSHLHRGRSLRLVRLRVLFIATWLLQVRISSIQSRLGGYATSQPRTIGS